MKWWYKRYWTWQVIVLSPFSFVYRLIVSCRRLLYKTKLFSQTSLPVPIIVVGNIVVGGTGKTPLVIALAQYFKSQGLRVGVISRGYRATTKTYPHTVNLQAPATEAGEEAFLIAEQTKVPVVIDPKRVNAAKQLLTDNPDCQLILSDDGLQHYALARDIEIVVTDSSRLFGNHWCLPAGPLREPLSRLKSVDFIVENLREPCLSWPKRINKARRFDMRLQALHFCRVNAPHNSIAIDDFTTDAPIIAMAGIGNPDAFFKTLAGLRFNFNERCFPDHHHYSINDLESYSNNTIIMTEKDAVKCRDFAGDNCWFLSVEAKLPEKFYQLVTEKLNERES